MNQLTQKIYQQYDQIKAEAVLEDKNMEKLRQILIYPLSLFTKDLMVKSATFSVVLLFIILSADNFIFDYFNEFYVNNKNKLISIRHIIELHLMISVLGFFVHRFKFCLWSAIGFYGIILIKSTWLIDKYIFQLPKTYFKFESAFCVCLIFIVLIVIFLQRKTIKNIR